MRILIVDRVWGFRQKIRGWLVQGGYGPANILEADRGDAALELMRSPDASIDAVICAWLDPAVDGPALAAQTRKLFGGAVDFLAVGEFDGPARAAAAANGAAEVIGAPVRPEILLARLMALEKRRATAQNAGPSRTAQYRLFAEESPAFAPAPLSAGIWSALRKSCRNVDVQPGRPIPGCGPDGARLWWVESGTIHVDESREDGTAISYKLGGEQFFGEFAFGGGRYVALAASAEEPSHVASLDADAVKRIEGENAILYYYLRNVSTNRARLFGRAGQPVEKGLSGNLDSLRILDLLQMLFAAKRTGILRLDDRGETIFLRFVDGQIVHAERGEKTGAEVAYQAMGWTRGQFELYVGPEVPGVRTVTTDMMKLLMEGARRHSVESPLA